MPPRLSSGLAAPPKTSLPPPVREGGSQSRYRAANYKEADFFLIQPRPPFSTQLFFRGFAEIQGRPVFPNKVLFSYTPLHLNEEDPSRYLEAYWTTITFFPSHSFRGFPIFSPHYFFQFIHASQARRFSEGLSDIFL